MHSFIHWCIHSFMHCCKVAEYSTFTLVSVQHDFFSKQSTFSQPPSPSHSRIVSQSGYSHSSHRKNSCETTTQLCNNVWMNASLNEGLQQCMNECINEWIVATLQICKNQCNEETAVGLFPVSFNCLLPQQKNKTAWFKSINTELVQLLSNFATNMNDCNNVCMNECINAWCENTKTWSFDGVAAVRWSKLNYYSFVLV